jgi:acyl-homoserine-lactone acylase
MGSNAITFSGATTANGRGLLLGTPHYPWQGGRRFWQSQQTIPGELNVSGGSLLGSTTISIGHNSRIAWSHTVATGVTLSLHQLTLDPADATSYLVDGKPERMTMRTVTVAVKDGAPVTRSQWWTRYGPSVNSPGASMPLPWTATTAYVLNDPNAPNLRASDTGLGFSVLLRGTPGGARPGGIASGDDSDAEHRRGNGRGAPARNRAGAPDEECALFECRSVGRQVTSRS